MWIKPKNPDDIDKIVTAVRQWLEESRFTAEVYGKFHSRWKHAIRVERVRKRAKEIYCGQHPNECVANPFFDRKERKGRWLEGSDWVGFNDGLNDVLDGLEVEADVWSYNREALKAGRYFIRKGRCRRVDYDSDWVNTGYRYVARSEELV